MPFTTLSFQVTLLLCSGLLCPVAARFFFSLFLLLSAYLFIVSFTAVFYQSSTLQYIIPRNSCSREQFYFGLIYCFLFVKIYSRCSTVMMTNVKGKKFYFNKEESAFTETGGENCYRRSLFMSGNLFYLHRLRNIQSTVYNTLCVVVKHGPEVLQVYLLYK